MILLAGGCVVIGMVPVVFWKAAHSAVAAWRGAWGESPTPESLVALGLIHMAVALSAAGAAVLLWRRVHRGGCVSGPTWDCGYAAPTPRMQYTAGSFAGIISEWFAWILRPVRHVHRPEDVFPRHAFFEEHTPETVLERVIEPIGRGVIMASGMARRLQHGRVQAYVLYLIVGLVAVAAMVLVWCR